MRQTSLPLFGTIIAWVEEAVPQDARERTIALWTNLRGLATLRAAHTLHLVYPDGTVEHLVPTMVDAHLS